MEYQINCDSIYSQYVNIVINFAKNLRYLREKKGLKQADIPGFSASRWGNYELGTSVPSLADFITITKYFGIPEDVILHADLTTGNLIWDNDEPKKLFFRKLKGKGKGNLKDDYPEFSGSELLLHEPDLQAKIHNLPPPIITVDTQGQENIILVPVKARAGYLSGYADPAYIQKLPAYRLPGLNHGTYRLFEVDGLSMYPTLNSGDLVIGQNVEQLRDIRDDRVYVVVTKNEGVVVKRILNRIEKDGKLILKSDNYKERDFYPPIVCDPSAILEVWYATGFISRQLRPPAEMYIRIVDLEGRLTLLEEETRKKRSK